MRQQRNTCTASGDRGPDDAVLMIEFQFRVSKAVTIWSEIAVRENRAGGVRSAATAAGSPMSTALRDGIQRLEVTSRVTHRRPRPRQRRLHLSRRPRAAQRQHHDRVLRRGDLFGRGDDRHLRVLVVPDAALAPRPRSHRPGPVVPRHAARLADDHRDVGLAQRHARSPARPRSSSTLRTRCRATAATSTRRTATRFRRRASFPTSRWRRRGSASSPTARRPARSPAPPVPARSCSC